MTIADTGVLLALLDAGNPRHDEAKKMLEQGAITVTPPTLTEMTRVIRRHALDEGLDGNDVAREAFALLRSLPGYRMAPMPEEEDVAETYRKDPSLSYADAWNLVAGVQQSQALATFDKKLQRAYKRRRTSQ